jgi:hypothetical protein
MIPLFFWINPEVYDPADYEPVPVVEVVEQSSQQPEPATGTLTGVAAAIADCESGNRLPNGKAVPGTYGTHLENRSGSTASGYFHFLDGTWQWVAGEIGASQYTRALHAPLSVQLEAFYWLYDNGNGVHHWAASVSCHGVR